MSEEHSNIIEDNKEMLLDILENVDGKDYDEIKCEIVDCLETYQTNQTPKIVAQMEHPDDKACFDFVSLDKPKVKDYGTPICLSKIDYNIPRGKEDIDRGIQRDLPMSFLSIKDGEIEKGKSWYLQMFPKLPEPMAELMAKYNWGDLKYQTKKKIKNDKKKAIKKGKKYEPLAFKVEMGKFYVSFD